jgi:hypothetical protein
VVVSRRRLLVIGLLACGATLIVDVTYFSLLTIACDTSAPPLGQDDFPCAIIVQLGTGPTLIGYVLVAVGPTMAIVGTVLAYGACRWRPLVLGGIFGFAWMTAVFIWFAIALPRVETTGSLVTSAST